MTEPTNKNTIDRLARLETCVNLKFVELDKALTLARDLARDERENTKVELDRRLEGMNQFQKRMDRLEGTFATQKELQALSKIIYIGIGIVLAIQFLFGVVLANLKIF